jgi:alpha/beta superfamily hydrolase
MTAEKIDFRSGDLVLEGLLTRADGSRGVVVTHPHPLYGGNMQNNVVRAITRAYREAGYTTLRFNFRGVGASQGGFDNGRGEQKDVEAALQYLLSLGCDWLDLAGYSFGSWVNAMGAELFSEVERLIMVSPPVAVMDFSALGFTPKIGMVISGSHDDIAPPEMITKVIGTGNPDATFTVLEGADHFYGGREGDLEKVIKEFLEGA